MPISLNLHDQVTRILKNWKRSRNEEKRLSSQRKGENLTFSFWDRFWYIEMMRGCFGKKGETYSNVYFEILLAFRRGNPFAKEIDFIGKEWCKVKGWRLDHTGSYWGWVIWERIKVGYICHYVF